MGINEKILLEKMIKTHDLFYNDEFWFNIDRYFKNKDNNIRLLEAACGPGLFIKDIYNRYNVSNIIAGDIGDDMISHTKKVIEELAIADTSQVIKFDFNSSDWHIEKNTTDIVFIGLAFRNIEVPLSFIENAYNILKKDGILIIYDFMYQPLNEFTNTWLKYVDISHPTKLDYELSIDRFNNLCKYTHKDTEFLFKLMKFNNLETTKLNTPLKTYIVTGKK